MLREWVSTSVADAHQRVVEVREEVINVLVPPGRVVSIVCIDTGECFRTDEREHHGQPHREDPGAGP